MMSSLFTSFCYSSSTSGGNEIPLLQTEWDSDESTSPWNAFLFDGGKLSLLEVPVQGRNRHMRKQCFVVHTCVPLPIKYLQRVLCY